MIPVSQAQEHRILISGFGFNNQGRYGRALRDKPPAALACLAVLAEHTTPQLHPQTGLVRVQVPWPLVPSPGRQVAHARSPDLVPFQGSTSVRPYPQLRPFPRPNQTPAPAPALKSRSARPQTDLTEFPHTAARGHNVFMENLGLFFSLFS